MTAFDPGEPRDPRVRSALEWMRVAASVVILVLIGILTLDRAHGGFEYVIALLGALGAVMGLPLLAKFMRKE